MSNYQSRQCAVCNTTVTPYDESTVTAHEMECYITHPECIPAQHRARYEQYIKSLSRSIAAKKAVKTKREKYPRWPSRATGSRTKENG